jgi:hypothetical protein
MNGFFSLGGPLGNFRRGETRTRLPFPGLGITLALFLFLIPWIVQAQVFMGKNKALKVAFPEADRMESETVSLTDEQRKILEQTAKATFGERTYTYHTGFRGNTLLRYAFIDTHVVKSKYETVLVVVSLGGEIEYIHILAFYEPPEYMPPASWLGQLIGKSLNDPIQIHVDVDTITGATVSTDSVAALSRKVLAFHKIFLQKKE